MLGDPTAILRLLHYEGKDNHKDFCPLIWVSTHICCFNCLSFFVGQVSDPLKGIYGAGAHTDFGFITLLTTDDALGLQV